MTTSAAPGGSLLGTAAESYERYRPGYPDEVVDRTLAYAGRQVTSAVEIGACTGKAARAFASRGVYVTALESDPDMLAVLRRESVGMQVEPVASSLADYDGPATELVYAAASWHHADPQDRCRRAADLLVDRGVVAVFGGLMSLADREVREKVEEARLPVLGDDVGQTGHELAGSELFDDVEEHRFAREVVLPQREYVGYLSTVSDYVHLRRDQRQDVLRRIADVLPAQVRLELTVRLHLARRA